MLCDAHRNDFVVHMNFFFVLSRSNPRGDLHRARSHHLSFSHLARAFVIPDHMIKAASYTRDESRRDSQPFTGILGYGLLGFLSASDST